LTQTVPKIVNVIVLCTHPFRASTQHVLLTISCRTYNCRPDAKDGLASLLNPLIEVLRSSVHTYMHTYTHL